MVLELGRLAVALAAVTAGFAALAAAFAWRERRDDLEQAAWRGLVAATGAATVALAVIVALFVAGDVSTRVVAAHWSVIVPKQFLPAALLAAPGAALSAWSACAGVVTLLTARSLRAEGVAREARLTGIIAGAAVIAISMAIVGLGARPLSRSAAFAADGAGLSPELQRGAAAFVAGARFVALVATVAPLIGTLAALAGRRVGDPWHRRLRLWSAVAAVAFVAAIGGGIRWHATTPSLGPWLSDPGTIAWLFPSALAVWLAWLGARPPTPERTVLRALLAIGAFVTGTAALALGGGAFVHGLTLPRTAAVGGWLALMPAGAMAATIALVRGGGGALREAQNLGALRPPAAARILTLLGAVAVGAAALGGYAARDHQVTLSDGEIFRVRDPLGRQWSFASQGVSTLRRDNFASLTLSIIPTRDEVRLPLVNVEARSYLLADGADAAPPAFITASKSGLLLDTRIAMVRAEGVRPTIRITFVPLASALVVGITLICGGILASLIAPRGADR